MLNTIKPVFLRVLKNLFFFHKSAYFLNNISYLKDLFFSPEEIINFFFLYSFENLYICNFY